MDKVLIVDDNEDVLESLTDGLEIYRSQFEVITAPDGSDAMKVLGEESISLVVTDLMMPKVGGLQLIAYMTKNYPATPVIVMTGYGTADVRDNILREGVLRYIEKPFHLKELASVIIEGLDLLDEGASLRGIAVSSFLPLIEMEQVTCLLQVKSATAGMGFFYFERGVLFDASLKKMKPERAALEMLTWEKVEISFLPLPSKKLEQRISSDLMSLVTEARRIKEKRAAGAVVDLESEDDEGVEVVDLDQEDGAVEELEELETELIIQEDAGIEIEQDVFLDIKPGREDSFREKLESFKDIEGFLAIAVFDSGGELIAGVRHDTVRMHRVGDSIFEIARKAQKSLKTMGFGGCDIVDMTAVGGEHFLVRKYRRKHINFVILLICTPFAEIGLFKDRLGLVAPSLAKELKAR